MRTFDETCAALINKLQLNELLLGKARVQCQCSLIDIFGTCRLPHETRERKLLLPLSYINKIRSPPSTLSKSSPLAPIPLPKCENEAWRHEAFVGYFFFFFFFIYWREPGWLVEKKKSLSLPRTDMLLLFHNSLWYTSSLMILEVIEMLAALSSSICFQSVTDSFLI